MRKVVKLVFGLVFSFGIMTAAKAQTAPTDSNAIGPSEDDAIVCVQVSQDMFDCYVMEDSTSGTNDWENNSNGSINGNGQNNHNKGNNKKNNDSGQEWTPSDGNSGRQPGRTPGDSGNNDLKNGKREIKNSTDDSNPEIQALKK